MRLVCFSQWLRFCDCCITSAFCVNVEDIFDFEVNAFLHFFICCPNEAIYENSIVSGTNARSDVILRKFRAFERLDIME